MTGGSASYEARAIAKDSTYMYVAGYDSNNDWHIEKRLLTTGALDTNFGTSGVVTGAGASHYANAIAIDSTYMYVAGYDSNSDWRIEKRLLSTGALDEGFGTSGVVTGVGASYVAQAISIDSTYMYVAGFDDNSDWRIEKRLLTTGALDEGFGTGGVITGASVSQTAYAISIDSTYMYVAGYDSNNDWRIEKRLLSTGAVDNGFGTSGVITGASTSLVALAISIDSTYMYVAGYDSNNDWRIEKRLLSTGAVDNGFGTSGVVTGASASNIVRAIDTDSTYMYVAGYNSNSDWRIEKRLLSTGALDEGFGTSGVITGAGASHYANAIATDSTYMYVAGYDSNFDWRIEKRLLSNGKLDAQAKLGNPLADENTEAETTPTQNLRLRILLHVAGAKVWAREQDFKLQYGLKSSSCSATTYSDVTSTTTIAFKNLGLVDGSEVEATSTDPTHSGHTIIRQSNQTNNLIPISFMTFSGQDMLFDFSLYNNNAPEGVYCFRVVKSNNTALDSYTQYPSLVYTVATAASLGSSGWSVELGSGGGVLITGGGAGGGDTPTEGDEGDSGGGSVEEGGGSGGGGGAAP